MHATRGVQGIVSGLTIIGAICGPQLNPSFLMYLLMASRDYIRGLASGAAHKIVYMPTVESFRICAPDRKKQDVIVSHLDRVAHLCKGMTRRISEQIETINTVPSALLRKAFEGGL